MSAPTQQRAQRTDVHHQMADMLFGYWVSHVLRAYPEPSVVRAPTSAANQRFLPLRAGFCHITEDA
jgi:hypothetical protein